MLPAQWDPRQRGARKEMWRGHLCAFDENSEPGQWREDQSTKLLIRPAPKAYMQSVCSKVCSALFEPSSTANVEHLICALTAFPP